MAISNRKFVRLPPDSTGKRAGASVRIYLEYNTKTGDFSEGDVVSGNSSTVVGTVLEHTPYTLTTGALLLSADEWDDNSFFTVGEGLLVNSVQQALASTVGEEVFWAEQVLVGGNNPAHKQSVDEEGAAAVRFTEGAPQFNAFGSMRVSNPTVIQEYTFLYGFDHDILCHKNSGSATASYSPEDSAMVLSCTSAAGDMSVIRSHQYHDYTPGIGQLIELSIAVGDTGKSEVIRRWGYFDYSDGLFFELSESVLYAVIRSSTSGVVTETKIPQNEWNGDRLDGTEGSFNKSSALLDVSKANLYWIDFQWLGVGNVRFGVYIDERRITCHTVSNPNVNTRAYMRTGNLPISVQQQNIGSAASSSEIRFICGVVMCDGALDPVHHYFSQAIPTEFYITSSTEWTHLFTGRSSASFNGKDNRTYGYVVSVYGHTTSPIQVEGVKNAQFSGSDTWISLNPESAAEFNLAYTHVIGGTSFVGWMFDGIGDKDLEEVFHPRGEMIRRKASLQDDPDTYTVKAKLLPGSAPATASFVVNWEEIQ